MSGPEIRFDNVAFSYGETSFLFDVAFPAGAITALMGPSGSGKSTLLNLLAGFEQPATGNLGFEQPADGLPAGRILIGGHDVTALSPAQRPISMIFQENNLFAHLDVERNVALGRSPSLRLSARDREDIKAALATTGLAGKERRLPRELSGGERQRVALARVLVRNRPILLLDEPFASLGPALREDMLDEVARLHAERGMTTLFVTHHPDDARRLAQHVAFLDGGRVAASGPAHGFFGSTAPQIFKDYLGSEG